MGELRNFARRMSTFTKFGGAAGDDIPNCSREGVCARARAGRMWRRMMMWTCMLPNITDGGRADRHNPLQSVSLSKVAGRISFCRGLLYGRLGWPDVLQGSTCPSIKVQIIVFVTDYYFLLRRIRRGCFQCEPSCLDASWDCGRRSSAGGYIHAGYTAWCNNNYSLSLFFLDSFVTFAAAASNANRHTLMSPASVRMHTRDSYIAEEDDSTVGRRKLHVARQFLRRIA